MSVLTLKITSGPLAGRCVVRARGRVSIGRSSSADLRIDEPGVHWEHAAVDVSETHATFENFAPGGTHVSGKLAQRTVRLKHGDTITISDQTTLRVSLPPVRSNTPRLVALALTMCVVAAVLLAALRPRAAAARREENWDRAFLILQRTLPESNIADGFGPVFAQELANAWHREQQGDPRAHELYQRLATRSAALMGRAADPESALRALQQVAATGDKVSPDADRLIGALYGFALERGRTASAR
ncbi:MAG: FHA domain-containing protein [Planctomycetes bacterium]|nr:FHA domain-containing protein [Planctomycetota bacterium]